MTRPAARIVANGVDITTDLLAKRGEDADGTYNAKTVTHTFDSGGYRTSVSLEVGGEEEF